jgi:protein gp37
MDHRYHKVKWGPNGTRVKTSEANWKLPLKWNREAEKTYLDACERYDSAMQPQARYCRRRVFCASLADVFEDWDGAISTHDGSRVLVCDSCGRLHSDGNTSISCKCSRFVERMEWATMSDLRTQLFALIDRTPWLDWLLLTKRPENIRAMWPRCTRCRGNGRIEMLEHCPKCNGKGMSPRRDNVWLGTTVENQEQANARIPEVLKCRDLSPILFLSCEPLLGPVDLRSIRMPGGGFVDCLNGEGHDGSRADGSVWPTLDWIITGAETGPADKVRITDPAWVRSLRDQCIGAGVQFHYKQDAVAGRAIDTPKLDGRSWVEFPCVEAAH